MKIKSIELINHKILGNLKVDFTDDNGKIVDTIIFAGENGCGKTTLLDIIYDFSTIELNLNKAVSNKKIIFEIELSNNEIQLVHSKNILLNTNGILKITTDFNELQYNWRRIIVQYGTNENDSWDNISSDLLFNDNDLKSIFYSIYSSVEINYNPQQLTTVTSKEVDRKIEQSIKSSNDIATDIKQMFIDIQNNDANELNDWVGKNRGTVPTDEVIDIRMKRFKKAFQYIFDNLNYKEIKTENFQKDVIFSRSGKEISISSLSSGEKQIVFRGGFLLQNQQSTKGCAILIDEPEVSLHPKWQKKILDFYKRLFLDESGNQTSQIFIVTHSPFIIHGDSRYNDKVIVLNRDRNDKIIVQDKSEYYNFGDNKIIEDAFDISDFNKNSNPIVFVEGETDEKYLKKCVELFRNNSVNYEIEWIGKYKNGSPQNSGDTALNQLYNFMEANPTIINRKVILLYDSDTNKPTKGTLNWFVRCMPTRDSSKQYNKGIENMLSLPDDFNYDDFYDKTKKIKDYGAKTYIETLNKTKLCDKLCDNLSTDKQKKYFTEIEKVLEIIEEIVEKE